MRFAIWIIHRSSDDELVRAERYSTDDVDHLGNAGIEIAHAVMTYLADETTVYVGDSITVATRKPRK